MEEAKIKKGLDLYLYYWVIPFFLLFFLFNYYLPVYEFGDINVNLMISIVTFLFGFLISISFSMILSRTSMLRDALSAETARLVSLICISKNFGKNFHEKITDEIDKYTTATLRSYTNYEVGREYVYNLYSELKNAEIKSKFEEQQLSSFNSVLNDFELVREKIEYSISNKLLPAIKLANYTLAILLISLLFLNRSDPFTNGLFIILSSVVIFILLIIEDYESLRIEDYVNNISNSEQIFDLIGKDRYYPEAILGRVELENGRNYRIGIYNPKEKKEKIFNLTYNKSFSFKVDEIVRKVLNKKV